MQLIDADKEAVDLNSGFAMSQSVPQTQPLQHTTSVGPFAMAHHAPQNLSLQNLASSKSGLIIDQSASTTHLNQHAQQPFARVVKSRERPATIGGFAASSHSTNPFLQSKSTHASSTYTAGFVTSKNLPQQAMKISELHDDPMEE